MAKKSIISEEQERIAASLTTAREISAFLAEALLHRLSAHPKWRECEPIALGSWARNELCPKSDIDLLFIGPEAAVVELVSHFEKEGLRLRYRVPQDPRDWTVGVEPFDIIALFSAKPFFAESQAKLDAQIARIRARKMEKSLLKAMVEEREERRKRHDSINQFLEPNLKYGPGGLRDLEQALVVHRYFLQGKKDYLRAGTERAERALARRKEFLLLLRQRLQLQGGGELLAATLQKDLATAFGYSDLRQFMSEVQRAFADVSFYADWMVAKALAGGARLKKIEGLAVKSLDAALSLLESDPDILVQERVRNELEQRRGDSKRWGKVLAKHFNPQMRDDVLRAFFRSQLMAKIIPDLQRVTGLVQHDQYHRLTVETHTLQAVREVLRVKRRPRVLGRLARQARALDEQDWSILLWTALYHDLGKGLDGDHSTVGQKIVKKDLTAMGVSLRQTIEIAWMVQNHLLMSGAAFRQNPQSPTTWQWLFDHGLKGKRIRRLAVFTAIDVRATNIEAWNDWKERLLAELADTLNSPKAQKFEKLLDKIARQKIKLEREFIEPMDPALVEELPNKVLVEDYARLHEAAAGARARDLDPLLIKARKKNELWVRFHSGEDRAGLFLNYVGGLYRAGAGVQEAFVQTYPRFGVYDWFKVRWTKSPAQLQRLLKTELMAQSQAPRVEFEHVDLVREDGASAILSFRGRDQKGALMAASQALYEAGLSLKWARVHTWGQQIDDVFSVESKGLPAAAGTGAAALDWQKIVGGLRQKFAAK